MTVVNLALLWGHIPRGIIRTTRHICRKYEVEVPFVLARDSNTGRAASTTFHSFGSYHFNTSVGPYPVSLVEFVSSGPESIAKDIIARLHAVSLGFPVVGDDLFPRHEKFFNPVVPIPLDERDLALQEWYKLSNSERVLLRHDHLTQRLLDGDASPRNVLDSILPNHIYTIAQSQVHSSSRYLDHPEASKVRRDRGVAF